jgi:hypothetical protein
MRYPSVTLIIVLFYFLNSYFLVGQVKYAQNNGGMISYSASAASINNSTALSGQISYSPKGIQGIGLMYLYNMSPEINGLGILLEQSLYRPNDGDGIGINIIASAAKTWSTVTETIVYGYVNGNFKLGQSEYDVKGQSAMLGLELFLHLPDRVFAPEPFFQMGRTFSKAGSSKRTITSNDNSYVFGIDSIIGRMNRNFGSVAFGYVIHDKYRPTFMVNVSMLHVLL